MVKKKALWIAGALMALAVSAAGYHHRQIHARNALHFDTGPVDRGRIVAKVMASGVVSAIVTVQVGSQVSGRLQDILVDYNSPVRKGQLIAKIDPQLFPEPDAPMMATKSAGSHRQ